MADASPLLNYLRERGAEMDVLPNGQRVRSFETQAADEIERFRPRIRELEAQRDWLTDEVQRLTRERDQKEAVLQETLAAWRGSMVAREQISAERDRLRAALEAIIEGNGTNDCYCCRAAIQVAREALGQP